MPTICISIKTNQFKHIKHAALRLFSIPQLMMTFCAILISTPIYAAEKPEEPILYYESYLSPLPPRKLFFIYGKGGTGYINSLGKVVLNPKYGLVDEVIYDGWARVADENLDKYYILDETSKKLVYVPGKWDGMFSEEMMSFAKNDQRPWLYGFMDKAGKVAIPPIFADVNEFREGLAAVRKPGDKYGFIDKKGNFIIEPAFDKVDVFSDGLAGIVLPGSRCSYINRSGKQALQASFKHCLRFSDGVARVMTIEGKWGYIDHSGKVISESVSPNAAEFELFSEGLSAVMVSGNKVGYINTKGEFVIPPIFKYALPFSEGLAGVSAENDLWGYIDKSGKYVISPRFCAPDGPTHGFFSEGLAFACDPKTKKYGYIDRSGKWVISPRFDSCRESSGYNCQFSGGLAWVETDTESHSGGHYHYVNRKGKYVWSFPRGEKGDDKNNEQFKEIIKPLTQ